jgi:hypothetical protein
MSGRAPGRIVLIAAEIITVAAVLLAARALFLPGVVLGLCLSVVLGYATYRHDHR